MVLVFTLLSKHRDQNPEARAGSAGVLWSFSALALTNFLTGCCPQNSFKRQFLRFLVIYRKLVHRQILLIFQLPSAISVFMNFVPQLYNCVLEIRSPSTEI